MLGVTLKKINPLLMGKRRDLVSIDLSTARLKIAHLRNMPNKKNAVNILQRDVTGLSDIEISKVIRASLYELEVRNPHIIDVMPAHSVITKNIEIPSINPQEIKEIINLQAGRHTPYSRDEIIVDYIDIGAYKHNYTKILLLIAVRSVVRRHADLLERAGFRLENVFLFAESLSYTLPKIIKIENENLPSAVMHIDENFSDFTIIFKSKVLFVRSIPIGAQQLVLEKDRYEAKFIEEIKRSIEAYQNDDIDKSPAAIILLGAVEQLRCLEILLNNNLPFPAKITPYFGSLPMSEDVFRMASLSKNLSFLNVVSPLFSFEAMKVNLIPEEVKLKRSLEEKGRDLVKVGIFGLAVFVLFFSILLSRIYFKSAYLKKLQVKFGLLNQETRDLEKDFSKALLIRNYLNNRFYSLEVLSELHRIAPQELELSDIRYDEKGKFSIRGTADSMSTVASLIENMKKSQYFKDVKRKYATQRRVGSKDVTDFEVSSLVNKNE